MQSVADGDPSQAYILDGEKYSGRKTLASAFSAALQCENKGREACGRCHSCKMAAAGSHPDILHVIHEKPGLISVSEIRSQLCEDVFIKPYYGPYKIYIVEDSQLLNHQAQNAMLKTLENPPKYCVIFLLTTSSDAFLETILSRCVILHTKPVADEDIAKVMIARFQMPDYEAKVICAFAQGNPGKAFRYAADEKFREIMDMSSKLLNGIKDKKVHELMEAAKG